MAKAQGSVDVRHESKWVGCLEMGVGLVRSCTPALRRADEVMIDDLRLNDLTDSRT